MKQSKLLKIFTDGASRGNPGPAACAFILLENDKIILESSEFIDNATNNIAEYQAIINALTTAENYTDGPVQVYSDSNLAVQQINKKWKVNYPHLARLRDEVYLLCKNFKGVEFIHVGRNNPYIQLCDEICNAELDAHHI